MKVHTASAINAYTLIALGFWGYYSTKGLNQSPTVWIPVIFGVALVIMNNGIKFKNKIISHIAVVLTFVLTVALVMALRGAIGREDNTAIIRVGIELLSCIFALFFFVKSFREARQNKA